MKKRMLSILMALAMILSLLPVTVLAADGVPCAGGEECTHVAAIGDVHYDTLAKAVYAVEDGQTIDLLRTTEGGGVKVEGTSGRTFTIDLHGFTYTVVDPTVGSTDTETNGFQLLKGSTITFKNGTIKPGTDAAKILFQNYCNLTLDNVTVDCAGSSCQYVVSNNCGNVIIKDSTLLAANGQAAFDLYYWPSNGYAEGVTVTVEGNSIINGRVEYGSDGTETGLANVAEKAVLTINSGTFTGSFYTYKLGSNKANITINRGTFSTDVSAYTGKDVACTDNGDGTFTVENLNAKNAVAEVNGTYYKTLSAAISRAQDGQTVKLLKDTVAGSSSIILKDGRTVAVDLNGHTIYASAVNAFKVIEGSTLKFIDSGNNGLVTTSASQLFYVVNGTLLLENGTFRSTATWEASNGVETATFGDTIVFLGGSETDVPNYTNFTLGANATIDFEASVTGGGAYAILINKMTGNTHCYGVNVDLYGDIATKNGLVAYINGTCQDKTGNVPTINIHNDAELEGMIYAAGYGKWNITGGELTGIDSGIAIKAGELNISGDAIIHCVGPNSAPTEGWSNGFNASGAAIQIESNSGYAGDIKVNISGGSVISDNGYSIYEYANKGNTENPDALAVNTLTIAGGYITGGFCFSKALAETKNVISVTGGYFTSDPSAYVADGKAALPSDNGAYAFMVGAAAQTDVEPAVGAPDVTMGNQIAAEDQETVKAAAASVTTSGELAAAANQAIGQVTEQQKADAEAAIKAEGSGVTVGEDNTVTIYAQTYLDITPTGYDKTQGQQSLTLDITPMYRVVASTADNAAAIKLEGRDKNAVVLEGSEKELTGIKNMTISIPLPTDFPTDNLYVKHTKDGAFVGYHKAAVSSPSNILTFTNDKGFSTFEIKADSRTATVDFGGETGQITYTPANVGDALPTAAAPDGQEFGGWTFEGIEGTYTTLTDDLLTKLAEKSVTITATVYFYTPSSGSTTYAITVSKADNGTVTASRTRASKNLTITLTVKADEGYKLNTLTVTDKNGSEVKLTDKGSGKYTFAMPASAVTVKASFVKDETPVETGLPFTDVKDGDWFYDAVKYVYDNKLMDGTSSTTFAPLMTTNRAMVVTILWRQAGSPVVNYAMNFGDVESGVWYTEAVRWAASEGIVKGYSDTVFAPDDTVTREQLATILYRYAEKKGYDVSAKGDLSVFTDGSAVSSWAADGTVWAVGAQLLSGKDGGKLDPTGTATRSEVATILMRFCENVAK